jgi:hypothetical protein
VLHLYPANAFLGSGSRLGADGKRVTGWPDFTASRRAESAVGRSRDRIGNALGNALAPGLVQNIT